jgi:hypothetical protein
VRLGEAEGPSLEVIVGRSLGWSDDVTLGCRVGASDAVAIGLVDGPAVVGLPLGLRLGEAEGPSLEVIVGRSLGWSVEVTLGCPVGAPDAAALGLVVAMDVDGPLQSTFARVTTTWNFSHAPGLSGGQEPVMLRLTSLFQ